MRPCALLGLLGLLGACGFHAGQLPADARGGGDDAIDATEGDAGPDGPVDAVAHVSAADEAALTSTFVWTIPAGPGVTIDTTTGTATPAFPADLHVAIVTQDGGGPELLVVQADTIEIGARLNAIGSRPLVLVATTEIRVLAGSGVDAGANHDVPGAGGAGPSSGTGAGGDGTPNGTSQDSGGTGASFGTLGGKGGNGNTSTSAVAISADPLPAYGTPELAILEGGSGGGDPSPMCGVAPRYGGAGGGALQLTAPSIVLDGVIYAGGGGGMMTNACSANGLGGGGGGSGGAIFLQATTFTGTGRLSATGGAGSGSADGAGNPGLAGDNGHPDNSIALGGTGQFGSGGNGATTANADPGFQGDNGGGAGGGSGRIYLAVPASLAIALASAPALVRAP